MRAAAVHLAKARFDLGDRQVLYKDPLRSHGSQRGREGDDRNSYAARAL